MRSPDLKSRLAPVLPLVVGFFGLMALGHAFPAFAGVIDLALPFFGLIGLGFICGRMFDFGEEGLAWVNVYIVYAALPSLMFKIVNDEPAVPSRLNASLGPGVDYVLQKGQGVRTSDARTASGSPDLRGPASPRWSRNSRWRTRSWAHALAWSRSTRRAARPAARSWATACG